jgi:hypothetical protein
MKTLPKSIITGNSAKLALGLIVILTSASTATILGPFSIFRNGCGCMEAPPDPNILFDARPFYQPDGDNGTINGGGWVVMVSVYSSLKATPLDMVATIFGPEPMTDPTNWSFSINRVIHFQNGNSLYYINDGRNAVPYYSYNGNRIELPMNGVLTFPLDVRSLENLDIGFLEVHPDGHLGTGDMFIVFRDRDADGQVEIGSGAKISIFVHEPDYSNSVNQLIPLIWPETVLSDGPGAEVPLIV